MSGQLCLFYLLLLNKLLESILCTGWENKLLQNAFVLKHQQCSSLWVLTAVCSLRGVELCVDVCDRSTHWRRTRRSCCWRRAACVRLSSVVESLRCRKHKSLSSSSAINGRSRLRLVMEPTTSAWLKVRGLSPRIFYSLLSDFVSFIISMHM